VLVGHYGHYVLLGVEGGLGSTRQVIVVDGRCLVRLVVVHDMLQVVLELLVLLMHTMLLVVHPMLFQVVHHMPLVVVVHLMLRMLLLVVHLMH